MDSAIQAFEDWRTNREKICRIPKHLWEIAVSLSTNHRYPLNTICKNLGLNWGDLRKKIDQLSTNANHAVKPLKHPSFVELKLDSQEQPRSLLLNQSVSPHCAVELTRPDGTVMKIFSSDDVPLNILELCKTFLGSHGSHQ